MKAKHYITFVMVFILMLKVVILNPNGLNTLFSGDDIAFVNPYCKRHSAAPDQKEKQPQLSQAGLAIFSVIVLNGQCTTHFQSALFVWETALDTTQEILINNMNSPLSHPFSERVSPPPRLV